MPYPELPNFDRSWCCSARPDPTCDPTCELFRDAPQCSKGDAFRIWSADSSLLVLHRGNPEQVRIPLSRPRPPITIFPRRKTGRCLTCSPHAGRLLRVGDECDVVQPLEVGVLGPDLGVMETGGREDDAVGHGQLLP